MSVIVATKFSGDTNAFRRSLTDRADEYRQIADRARAAGALHHQFAVGDGFVVIQDEWESQEAFRTFFSDPELQAFIASVGGDANSAPEVLAGESVDSPDKF
jgi:quinol monooxygenase YgiN